MFKRNYKLEYQNFQGKPEQIKRRSSRNKARGLMMKKGKVHKGDGQDVNHRGGNPLINRPSNLQVESASANRSYPRTKKAHKKNPLD